MVPIRVASESLEKQIKQQDDKKPLAPKAENQSHKPAKHIEETARLTSSVETANDPSKVRRTKIKPTPHGIRQGMGSTPRASPQD
jgi:hypothetical protein